MKKIKVLVLAFLVIGIMCLSTYSIADVGDFESYDSDWGSSWDSSWDSDWDSSSSWDYDYGYGGSSYSGDYDEGTAVVGWIIVVIILIVVYKACKSKNPSQEYAKIKFPENRNIKNSTYVRNQVRSEGVANKIREVDKQFNDEKFLAWVKNLFIKLQTAWSERDWEAIRPLESEDLFEQHAKQLKGYIDRKQINKMERICVNFAELVSFTQDNEKDIVVVALNSSMVDYIIDEASGKVLKGSKDYRLTNTYKLTFIRKKGLLTEEGTDKLKTTNCPNCGAPTVITSSGKCEFCGSVITTGSHDWVLGDMERF